MEDPESSALPLGYWAIHMYYTINLRKNHKIINFYILNCQIHGIFNLRKGSLFMKKIFLSIVIMLFVISVGALSYHYLKPGDESNKTKESKKVNKKNDNKKNNKNEIIDNDNKTKDNKNDNKKDNNKDNSSNKTKKVISTDNYPALSEVDGEKIVIGTSSKGYTIYTKSGVTYVDGIMIVNKSYPLPEDYIPRNTHTSAEGRTNTCNTCINETAYQAFNKMKADAASIGLNIYIQSGYRPYSTQKTIYNRYVARDGQTAADTYSARPGASEHQSGLCFDLNSISDAFANTAEGKWVNENAYRYGFVIRFPKGKQGYTGYKYESWHLRYVGTDLAKELYNNGDWISLEEYYGLDSEYKD